MAARLSSSAVLITLIVSLSYGKVFRHYRPYRFEDDSAEDEESHERIWALLVAGSDGWSNYRHQSDLCHAYHVLREHGVPEDRIVTMMYDDIANSELNPYPGKIFNTPHGEDVYKGVRIDYKNIDVTAVNFLAILQGNASAVQGGNGRFIHSNADDHVFVYFTDHGATGMVAFPDDMLTVKDLNDALRGMNENRQFKKLVFYMEACESGSMFEKVLPRNMNVYAVTASNSRESSWGCYCDNDMGLPCMGDLFSVNWMDDSDEEDLKTETLKDQFKIIQRKTNLSHVMHFGDLSIAKEPVADFMGWKEPPYRNPFTGENSLSPWPARDIYLLSLHKSLEEAENEEEKHELRRKIRKIKMKRDYLENFMVSLVDSLIHDPSYRRRILRHHPHGLTQLDCHDRVVKAFHRSCFHFGRSPYALKYVYVLAGLCEEGIETETILRTLLQHCLDVEIVGIH